MGGILLGTLLDSGRSVVIEDYQTVTACLRKERFYDSDQDRATLERVIALWQPDPNSNIYAIGFFRSDSRASLKPEEGDRNALSRYLPQSDTVLLLLGANRDKAAEAALYFAEDGQLRRRSPCLRFPFDRSELADKSVVQPHPGNGAGRTPLRIVGRPQQKLARNSAPRGSGLSLLRWLLIAVAVAGLLAAALLEYRVANLLSSHVRTESRPASALGLRTERNGSELLLSWDPAASAIAAATRGHLSIVDGQSAKELDLKADDLRRGRIAYTAVTDDVTFRLEVAGATPGKSVVESLRVLFGTPPVPAAVSPGSVPPPISRRPTPRAAASPAPVRVSSPPVGPNHPPAEAPLPGEQQAAAVPLASGQQAVAASHSARAVAPALPARAAASILVGGNAQPAVLMHKTLPVYPPVALLKSVSGVVRITATVATDGALKGIHIIDGPLVLREAAIQAVRQWRYRPALLDGKPIEATTTANVVFRLNN